MWTPSPTASGGSTSNGTSNSVSARRCPAPRTSANRWLCCSATSDHFKGYKERLGHTTGDRALRAVSGVLLRSIRQADLGALKIAERIRAGVAALDLGGPERELTVSVGLATFPDDDALIEELVDKAAWAMYLAKRQGRDRVLAFGPGAHEQTSEAPATT